MNEANDIVLWLSFDVSPPRTDPIKSEPSPSPPFRGEAEGVCNNLLTKGLNDASVSAPYVTGQVATAKVVRCCSVCG
jgi:hypothetical protein